MSQLIDSPYIRLLLSGFCGFRAGFIGVLYQFSTEAAARRGCWRVGHSSQIESSELIVVHGRSWLAAKHAIGGPTATQKERDAEGSQEHDNH